MRRRTPRRFQYFMRNPARSFQESSPAGLDRAGAAALDGVGPG